MKRTLLTAAAVACVGLAGCTLQYDRYGNPIGAGLTIAATEEPTTFDRAASAATDAAWLIDPKLGILATTVAGAFGVGSHRGKRTATDKYEYADKTYYEGRQEVMLQQAPTVNPAEVSA